MCFDFVGLFRVLSKGPPLSPLLARRVGSGASHHMLVFLGRKALLLSEVGSKGSIIGRYRTSCTSRLLSLQNRKSLLLQLMTLQSVFARTISRLFENGIVIRSLLRLVSVTSLVDDESLANKNQIKITTTMLR